MKLIHLSDLHLGKRVNGFSMIEEQEYILNEILHIVKEEQPDGILIAGDVYDKSVPSAEAVTLFDHFLAALSELKQKAFIISGNHDSAERLAFGASLMQHSGIYFSQVYSGHITPITLEDTYGAVKLWLLPFLKPANVRRFFPDQTLETYTDALAAAINEMDIDTAQRNVLITHQFVTGAVCCDSEERSVGGTDNVDAAVFDPFDYVALGHIHGPQRVCRDTIRYCGSPLKYSFSEANHKKSVTIVEFEEKGTIALRTIPLIPKRDLREIKGTYAELTERAFYHGTSLNEDYLHITLTDEEDVPDAITKLRIIYPYLMKLDYDNCRTRSDRAVTATEDAENKSPLELFSAFYEMQNNQPMSEAQTSFLSALITEIWEGEE